MTVWVQLSKFWFFGFIFQSFLCHCSKKTNSRLGATGHLDISILWLYQSTYQIKLILNSFTFLKVIFFVRKQLLGGVVYKECSSKFRQIYKKTPVSESLFKRLQHRCFPVNFVKVLNTFFPAEHLQGLLLLV